MSDDGPDDGPLDGPLDPATAKQIRAFAGELAANLRRQEELGHGALPRADVRALWEAVRDLRERIDRAEPGGERAAQPTRDATASPVRDARRESNRPEPQGVALQPTATARPTPDPSTKRPDPARTAAAQPPTGASTSRPAPTATAPSAIAPSAIAPSATAPSATAPSAIAPIPAAQSTPAPATQASGDTADAPMWGRRRRTGPPEAAAATPRTAPRAPTRAPAPAQPSTHDVHYGPPPAGEMPSWDEYETYMRDAADDGPPAPASSPASPPPAPATPEDAMRAARQQLGDCRACRLCEGRTQIVWGVGDVRARLFFVGEGPGEQEDLRGEPFVGPAGQLLDRMITAMGLTRSQVYIGNVVKCRPPGNRAPHGDEMKTCVPHLRRQIEIVKPDVLVALGKTAMEGLTGASVAITRVRGTWTEFAGIPLMPTLHPAYLLRTPAAKRDAWSDLQAVMTRLGLTGPSPSSPDRRR